MLLGMQSVFAPESRPHSFLARLAPLALGAVALAVVIGCQSVVPQTPPAAARVVEFDASDYSFNAPATLPSGIVTIRLTNHGQEPHHGQLLRLNDGVSFDQFTAALQSEGEGALQLTTGEGGPGTTDPHNASEVTLDLKPGTYALVCFIAGEDGVPHIAKGMLKPITVTESSSLAAAPEIKGTFTMKDFSFDMPDTLPVGEANYRVVNSGAQEHELNVVKLAPGKSAQDLLAWEKAPAGPPPFESAGGINAFSANGSGYMKLSLQPGTYVAVCHVPDPASGVPHIHLGMYKQFTVKG
jgi:hypothetical protein